MASGLDEMIEGAVEKNTSSSRKDVIHQDGTHKNAENAPESRSGRTQQEKSAMLPLKRRGRPPKERPSVTTPTASTPAIGITEPSFERMPDGIPKPPPKRRGRPRKDKSAIVEVSAQLSGEATVRPTFEESPEETPEKLLTPPSRLRRRLPLPSTSSPLAKSSVLAHPTPTSTTHLLISNFAVQNTIPALSSPDFQTSGDGVEPAAETTLPPTSRSRDPSFGVDSFAPAPALISTIPDLQQTGTGISTRAQDMTKVDIISQETRVRKKYDTSKKAIFTSHDQLQRSAGVPGVYFDLPDLYHKRDGTLGRPKKQIIALFKTEKLKNLSWMRDKDVQGVATSNTASTANEVETPDVNGINEGLGLALKRKRDELFENGADSPNLKRTLLEVARDFGKTPLASYKSPYQSSPYVSPYQQEAQPSISFSSQDGIPTNSITFLEHQLGPVSQPVESPPLSPPLHSPALMENNVTQTFEDSSSPTIIQEQRPPSQDSQILQDGQLQIAIQAVANIEFTDVACRLPASKDGNVGNLCLSADKKLLKFVPGENQADKLIWSVQITEVSGPPQISPSGTLPVELHFNTRDEAETESVQCFKCLNTEHGYQAANNMRAKIVTALTILGLWDVHLAGDSTWEDPERPFKCEECGGVWKNQGGLIYHQTKSKTSCNPSYIPYGRVLSRGRARSILNPTIAIDDGARDIALQLTDSAVLVDHDENSIAVPNEVKKARATTSNTSAIEITLPSAASGRPDQTSTSTSKPPDADGIVDFLELDSDMPKRKEIIMELLDAYGNVFPADKGLWFSYVSVWLRKFPKSTLPSYSSFNAAINLLTDTGNVRRFVFSFRDKLGLMVSRAVVARKGVDPVSPWVIQLKDKIKAAYPEYYIPPDFAPSKAVQSMLEEREKGQHAESSANTYPLKISQVEPYNLEQGTDIVEIPSIPIERSPDKITRSGRVSRAPQRLYLVEDNLEFQSGLDIEEDDYSLDEESPRKTASSEKTRSLGATSRLDGRLKQARLQNFDEKLKRFNIVTQNDDAKLYDESQLAADLGELRRRGRYESVSINGVHIYISDEENYDSSDSDVSQESLRERRSNTIIQSRDDTEQGRNTAVRRPHFLGSKTVQKRRVLPEFWQPALAYLQIESGAWANSTPPRKRNKYNFKQRMPEPITYMQTLTNSTWSFRPFGHGVRPIHARPSRRVEGNPTAELYDEKVQNGFRPVLMPSRRKFGPALPSKNISLSSPIRGKKRRLSSTLRTTETEHIEHRRKRRVKEVKPKRPLPIPVPQDLMQESRQTSVISDVDSHAQSIRKWAREDSPASDYGPSSGIEQSPKPRSSRMLQSKSMPVDPAIEPLSHSLQYQNDHEPPILLAGSYARSFLNNDFEGSGAAEAHKSGTVYMNRSKGFLRHSYSPTPAEPHLQEDDQEVAEDDQDFTLSGAPGQIMQGQPQGPRQLTQRMMKTRRLTALPADVEGIVNPNAVDSDFSVEIAYEHQRNLGLRKRIKLGSLTVEVENRIMLAVVIIRTLTGGLDKSIDWVLVSKMFQDFPMNFISKRWAEMQQKHKMTIEKLNTSFQEWFLEVYERGEIAPINYDHLLDYDWESLIDSAGKELRMNVNKENPKLPATFSEVNEMYTMKKAEDYRPWRDEFFGLLQPVYRRMENAASEQHTTPIITDMPHNNFGVDHLIVAKSWARASILTPAGIYDPAFATKKLAQLNHGQVKVATDALLASKVLMQRNKGRATPGRGFEITDTFAAAFRKHLDENQLTQAVAYKTFLDDALRANQTIFVEWTANEGQILAITNLQANSRIRLEPKDVPNNKFGLTGGDYQTKRMDKAKLRFNMQIIPTESYLYDPDIPILSNYTGSVKSAEPPRAVAYAIPLWYDISENLMPAMWKKVLCTVLGTIALRPGVDVKELVRLFNPALEEWELRLLLDWGVSVGALTVLREGYEGWNVGEWWWLVGGKA